MVPNIPFDIWLEIVSHLPEKDRKNLYSLNQALFEISMNERYKVVNFRYVKEITMNLELLSNQANARRVRTVHLWPHMIVNLHPVESPPKRWHYNPFRMRALRKREAISATRTAESVEKAILAMKNMTGVNQLMIRFTRPDTLPDFVRSVPIVKVAWEAIGSNIQDLELAITLWGWTHALSPTLTFPRLKYLAIMLPRVAPMTQSTDILCDLIAPFVNNHYTTLQRFALLSDETFDLSSFLKKLRHFPYLCRLHCSLTGLPDSSILERILETHSTNLPTINLRLNLTQTCEVCVSKKDGNLHIVLPRTEQRLVLKDWDSIFILNGIFYRRTAEGLPTYLVQGFKAYQFPDARHIVSCLSNWNHIKILEADVSVLSDTLMNLFATKLPNLHQLDLSFERIGSARVGDHDPGKLFCDAMFRNRFRNWKLAHFSAVTLTYDSYLQECASAIDRAIPSLKTIKVALVGSMIGEEIVF